MEVGLVKHGEAAENDEPRNGDDAREGRSDGGSDDESVGCSGVDVTMRESSSAPSSVIRISCTLTDQPAWKAGVEKANVAKTYVAVARIPRASGGRTECDFNACSSFGASSGPSCLSSSGCSENLYSEMSCVAVMVMRYGEQYAVAEIISSDDGLWVYAERKNWLSSANSKIVNEPSSKPTTTL